MTAQHIVTAICFALLTAEVLYVIISYFRRNRSGRIAFVRSFKRGKCAVVYLSVIPLFFIGVLFSGRDVLESLLLSITKSVELVVLKYDVNVVKALIDADLFYKITMYYAYTLVALNAVLFVFSLAAQSLWQARSRGAAKRGKMDKLFIFGCNDNNTDIWKSAKGVRKTLVGKNISKETKLSLYAGKIRYMSVSDYGDTAAMIFSKSVFGGVNHSVVVNTENEETNLEICRRFIERIKSLTDEEKQSAFRHLHIFVFGDPRYEAIYEDVTASANGCIHYVSKYRMIAMNFVDRYPLTRFMDARHIDYATSFIRKDVEINVCMIGFGKTNRSIFMTSVANNQFITADRGGARLKKVNYHIFDRENAENDKNLNHSYYRYKTALDEIKTKDYLPLPSLPATELYYKLDINDPRFYREIKTAVTRSESDVNIAVIAFGTDLENIDMAQKLTAKKREWGIDNLVIMVKVRKRIGGCEELESSGCLFIGNEREDVYDYGEIIGDEIYRMAMLRNEIYDLEYSLTHGGQASDALIAENKKCAVRNWFCAKTQSERESSLYCCLSLRSKLNLMGLDYVKTDAAGEALSEKEYLEIYAADDMPDTQTYSFAAAGKKIVYYTLDFKDSRRKNLAVQEHLRWNSFMISKGMIPASKRQILEETALKGGKTRFTNGRNYPCRRHGNLTTFDGLVAFRKMIAERDNVSEEQTDVIKYDYQLLDDAYWLLASVGCKIVRRDEGI